MSVKADELEIRLKTKESKLNQRTTERVNITDVIANASTVTTDDRLLLIKNLPYGMKDNEIKNFIIYINTKKNIYTQLSHYIHIIDIVNTI